MKTQVILLWTACLVAITLSVLRFVWLSSAAERLLLLALLVLAVLFALRGKK